MKERPILFSAPMVRAILDGRKTQTRRVVRGQVGALDRGQPTIVGGPACPYGAPGDRLWVRETWAAIDERGEAVSRRTRHVDQNCGDRLVYRADDRVLTEQWRSPLFMPRWASRITLEVTTVRVERLQAITEEDACAEGVTQTDGRWWDGAPHAVKGTPRALPTAREAFADLWDAINGKRAPWSSNPWVWVVSFRRVER